MTFGGLRLSWLLRRWWVMAASVVGVVVVALIVARPAPVEYTAEAVLIVRSGATESQPGSANEANRLAVTYAELVPQDTEVLEAVAAALNIDTQEVRDSVSAVNDPNTSILRARFTAGESSVAVAGARAVAAALVGANPAGTNFRGVALSNLPDSATRTQANETTLPTAMLLGLLVGGVLIIAIERSRGRIDTVEDLERELPCPVSSLDGMQAGAISALLTRWAHSRTWMPYSTSVDIRDDIREFAEADREDDESSPVIALVAGAKGNLALTQEVASVFASTAHLDENFSVDELITLRSGGAPGSSEVGERTTEGADVVVLVVAEGTSLNALRKTLTTLVDFGAAPRWALFAPDPVVRRSTRHYDKGVASEAFINKTQPRHVAE